MLSGGRNRVHWELMGQRRPGAEKYHSLKESLHKKMKFFVKDFFSKFDQIRRKWFGHIY